MSDQFMPNTVNQNNDFCNFFILNETHLVYDSFFILRKTSFTSFFIDNLINVPSNFKKIKSLKRKSNEFPILKIINFLLKKGKKEQYTKLFFSTLSLFFSNINYIKNSQTLNNFNKKYSIQNSEETSFIKLNNIYHFKQTFQN